MPLPDHVVSERLNSGEANGESSRVDQRKVSKGPAARKGIRQSTLIIRSLPC